MMIYLKSGFQRGKYMVQWFNREVKTVVTKSKGWGCLCAEPVKSYTQ